MSGANPDTLVADWRGLDGLALVRTVLGQGHTLRVAVTSSFGAESAVLLDLVAQANPDAPVLFVDTGKLFPETLDYRDSLVEHLGLTQVRTLRAPDALVGNSDLGGTLYERDPDACCHVRKVMPYAQACADFDVLIGGRKRHHGDLRTRLETAERAGPHIKVNPLAHYSSADIEAAFKDRNLPRHPLVSDGYVSLGCAPCTHMSCASKGARAGRWTGHKKTECGIHFNDNPEFKSLGELTQGEFMKKTSATMYAWPRPKRATSIPSNTACRPTTIGCARDIAAAFCG